MMPDEARQDDRDAFFASYDDEITSEGSGPKDQRGNTKHWRVAPLGFFAATIMGGLVVGLAHVERLTFLKLLLSTYWAGNLLFFCAIVDKMFENDMADLAWASVIFTCLLWGPLLVFAVGWFYSGQWNCRNWMLAWTFWEVTGFLVILSCLIF